MLDELRRVCDVLGIRFFLDAGTLLGAIRHQGFIPWDDDVDVCMIRSDYDRLMQEGPEVVSGRFFLQTPSNSPQMPASYMKLRLNGTSMVEATLSNVGGNHGIWVDIFPFDYFDANTNVARLRRSEALWGKMFDLRQRKNPSEGLSKVRSIARGLIHGLLKLVPRGCILSKMSMPIPPTDGADGFMSCLHYGSCFFWIKWSDAFPPAEVIFEGRKMLALGNYRDYLEQVYGDWQKLPPVAERTPHHFVTTFDLGDYAL
ncbi:LicD family protein [Rubneribacter sp.]